jgi:hypothetical protein
MSASLARGMMTKAAKRLAEKQGVSPKVIAIVTHPLINEENQLTVGYYLAVNGKPLKDEEGITIPLRFRQDILGKTMDILGYEQIVGSFLAKRFQLLAELYEEKNFALEDLELLIMPQTEQVIDFNVLLCHKRKFERSYTLDEIFEIG